MRHLALLLLFFAFGLALPACAQKATSQKVKVKKPTKKKPGAATPVKPNTEAGPVLTFERTPCFGMCPAYKMQVYADGRVSYEGRRAVPMMGPQDLKIPAATVADMLRTAQEAHFENFQKEYSRGTSDLPSTVIAIRQPGGALKTVAVQEAAPDNVNQFVLYLTRQFDALAQLNVDR